MAEGVEGKLAGFSSFIADLPSAVQKFWNAVAAPIFELSITLIVLFFAVGDKNAVQNAVQNAVPSELKSLSYPQATDHDTYGVRLLIPIAFLVLLLGVAQANSTFLRAVGAMLPVKLVPKGLNLVLTKVSPVIVVEAWQYHPKLTSVAELNTVIDNEVGRIPQFAVDNLSKSRVLRARSEMLESTAGFIKGLLVASIGVDLFWIFERHEIDLGHLATIFGISFIILIYLAFSRIQAEREYATRKVQDYITYKGNSMPPGTDISASAQLNEQRTKDVQNQVRAALYENAWTLKFAATEAQEDLRTMTRAAIEGAGTLKRGIIAGTRRTMELPRILLHWGRFR
jgi:hypothetical protein